MKNTNKTVLWGLVAATCVIAAGSAPAAPGPQGGPGQRPEINQGGGAGQGQRSGGSPQAPGGNSVRPGGGTPPSGGGQQPSRGPGFSSGPEHHRGGSPHAPRGPVFGPGLGPGPGPSPEGAVAGLVMGALRIPAPTPPPVVVAEPAPVVVAPSGYWQERESRVWVEGCWIETFDAYGRRIKQWQPGRWEVRRTREWVQP